MQRWKPSAVITFIAPYTLQCFPCSTTNPVIFLTTDTSPKLGTFQSSLHRNLNCPTISQPHKSQHDHQFNPQFTKLLLNSQFISPNVWRDRKYFSCCSSWLSALISAPNQLHLRGKVTCLFILQTSVFVIVFLRCFLCCFLCLQP